MKELTHNQFECEHCGGTVLTVDDAPSDDTIVRCKSCNVAFCTFGEIKMRRVNEALNLILREATNRLKGQATEASRLQMRRPRPS